MQLEWYDSLVKPAWTPAPGVIGTIWTLLYPIIIVTFGYVIFRVVRGTMPASVLLPLAINVVANVAFTPIQFGLRNLGLASVDIVVVLVTIVWCMVVFWPYARWTSIALVPYLIWVGTASTLQFSIWWLNR